MRQISDLHSNVMCTSKSENGHSFFYVDVNNINIVEFELT